MSENSDQTRENIEKEIFQLEVRLKNARNRLREVKQVPAEGAFVTPNYANGISFYVVDLHLVKMII
jgi:hypothetical protein